MPALDLRIQAYGHSQISLTGIVDSGATCTVLSLEVAEQLGLSRDDLREADDANIAGGIRIPTWTTDVPIRAQVHNALAPGGTPEPWGPIFELRPIFLQAGPALWGQEDFCATFQITLQRHLNPAHFTLEYW